jgi:outer membrane protein OmpA-like peptidoglycan-associated protein
MPMSDSSPSVWQGLFWLLLMVLIGVYVAYSHYADTLEAQVVAVEKDAEIASDERMVADRGGQVQQVGAYEQRIAETERELAAVRADLQQQAMALEGRLAQVRQTNAQLRAFYGALADLGACLTGQGIRLTLAGDALRFPSGSATLPDGDLTALGRIAELLREYSNLSARIEGHTDSSGSAAINRRLSEQRAAAVKDALVKRGIAGERLSAEGLGADRPIADNATDAGREANRRVELWIDEPAGDRADR